MPSRRVTPSRPRRRWSLRVSRIALWTGPLGPRHPRRRSHPLRSWARESESSGISHLAGGLLALLQFLLPALLGVASLAQGRVDLVPDLLEDLDCLRAQLRCSGELEGREVELRDRRV